MCTIEMDCNKHATNVDNSTAWKHSKPFSKCKHTHTHLHLVIRPSPNTYQSAVCQKQQQIERADEGGGERDIELQ